MKRPQTLLIVEDDPNLRRLYQEEFTDEGYDVLAVCSGEEALVAARGRAIDCSVLDIRLGGIDGLALMRALLSRHPGMVVILNTAYTHFKSDFASWGAERYVVKSSDLEELKAAVRDCLEKREAA